jgi:adenylate cyclase
MQLSFKILILTFFTSLPFFCFAQDKADSIRTALKLTSPDSVRINLLLDLSKTIYHTQPDEAIKYATEAKDLAIKAGYQKEAGYALKNIGLAYYAQGNYPEVLIQWGESLKIFTSIGDKLGEANILNNIGAVYYDKGDYVRSLDYYLKSLNLSEELKDTVRIATALVNIGSVYQNNPTTFDKAFQNYELALEMFEQIGDLEGIASSSANVGQLYIQFKKYDEALASFQKSRNAYQKLGDSHYLAWTLSFIGKAHALKGDFNKAIRFQEEAIKLSKQYGYKLELVRSLRQLGETYSALNEPSKSITIHSEAETIAEEIEAKYELRLIYENLAEIYAKQKNFEKAYDYQQVLMAVKDSIFTDDNAKTLDRLQFEFDLGKKESQINLLTKDKELQELELQKQKFTKNALIIGSIFLLTIAFILLKNYQIKVKANRMLSQQNQEILQQKEEIESQRDDIESQKEEIESLILNILPIEVAQELRKTGRATPQYHESVTVLFTDFREFTKMAESMSAQRLVEELNNCFIAFDEIIELHGLEKIKTIGDAYMCACGIPSAVPDHALRTVRAALDIQQYIRQQNNIRKEKGETAWELRIGINTGSLIAGVVGRKKFAYDIWGNAVNIAARLEANGSEGKVNISNSTYQLIKDEYECHYRGKITAKNMGEVDMYFVENEIKKEILASNIEV